MPSTKPQKLIGNRPSENQRFGYSRRVYALFVAALFVPLIIPQVVYFIGRALNAPQSFLTDFLPATLIGILILFIAIVLLGIASFTAVWRYFSKRLNETSSKKVHPNRKIHTYEKWIISVILAAALILRLHDLNRGLSYDELYTAYRFIESGSFLRAASSYLVFNNHIAYSLLARLTQVVLGRGEWAIRLPALLMGLFSIFMVWRFGRTWLKSKTALLASGLLAVSPVHVLWSTSARGYTGLMLFSLISTILYFQIIHSPSRRNIIFYIIANVFGIYFHLYAVWVLVIQMVFLLIRIIRRVDKTGQYISIPKASFKALMVAFPLIGILSSICYLPVFLQFWSSIHARGAGGFRVGFPVQILNDWSGQENLWVSVILFLFAATALLIRWKQAPIGRYLFYLFFVPVTITWLLVRPMDLYPRFFCYFLPFFYLLTVQGAFDILRVLQKRWSELGEPAARAAVVTLGVMITLFWVQRSWTGTSDEGYREGLLQLQAKAHTTMPLCVMGADVQMFDYYANRPLLHVHSMEDLERLMLEHHEIRIAYHDVPWNREECKEMAHYLSQNADCREFKRIVIYTVNGQKHRDEQLTGS